MKIDNRDISNYFKAKKIAEVIGKEVNDRNSVLKNSELVELMEENPLIVDFFINLSNDEVIKEKSLEIEKINADKRENITILVKHILKVKKRNLYFKLIVASSSIAAALLFVSFLLINGRNNNTQLDDYVVIQTIPKIINNAPTLILANGESLNLSTTVDRIFVSNSGVVKNSGNSLIYDAMAVTIAPIADSMVEYNTIVIPKMFTYKVMLEDGTQVMLNANSEFRYPVKFNGSKREVFLSGEAFFDVKKGEKPFIVHSMGVDVKVYGTRFNVNSYNCNNVKTALLSGKVGVSYSDNQGQIHDVIVQPNELVIVDLNTKKSTLESIEDGCIDWVDGYLNHNSNRLESYIEKLAMWYGFDFYFEKEHYKDVIITCSFSTDSSLSEVLSSLEKITGLFFEKKGDAYVIR